MLEYINALGKSYQMKMYDILDSVGAGSYHTVGFQLKPLSNDLYVVHWIQDCFSTGYSVDFAILMCDTEALAASQKDVGLSQSWRNMGEILRTYPFDSNSPE